MSDEKKPDADAAAEQPVEPTAAPEEAASTKRDQAPDHGRLPPATLSLLLTSLGTQALMSLGQIPHPATNKPEIDREQARHCIDLLGMLEEKTAGNRTEEESQLLDGLLYELRMLFLQSGK